MEKKSLRFAPKKQQNTIIAKPKDASSLVILKKTNSDVKVLLGKRSDKTRFMPGAWVFPGGVVDKNDYKIKINTSINPKIIPRLIVSNNINNANALALAAIRETAEETGLFLGKPTKNINQILLTLIFIMKIIFLHS